MSFINFIPKYYIALTHNSRLIHFHLLMQIIESIHLLHILQIFLNLYSIHILLWSNFQLKGLINLCFQLNPYFQNWNIHHQSLFYCMFLLYLILIWYLNYIQRMMQHILFQIIINSRSLWPFASHFSILFAFQFPMLVIK